MVQRMESLDVESKKFRQVGRCVIKTWGRWDKLVNFSTPYH